MIASGAPVPRLRLDLGRTVPSLEHLLALTDDTGTIQHATFDVPNRSTGYCTDDIARALIVAIRAGRTGSHLRASALNLARTSLSFLDHAQRPDGRFHNFMSYERTWLDDVGGEDANGRAIWALGVAMRYAPTFGFRAFAREIFDRALPAIANFEHLRSRAFAALGVVEALAAIEGGASPGEGRRCDLRDTLGVFGDALCEALETNETPEWTWFEERMTYDNARLCEALLRVGTALGDARLLAAGSSSLAFFARATIRDGVFEPVGNDGWFVRGSTPAIFGQQPLEAAALVDAALAGAAAAAAFPSSVAGDARSYEDLAVLGRDWFHGANRLGRSLVSETGACADGLEASGASANAGAESTLAYLSAAYAVAESLPDR